ncbi:MAG: hypothetical protein WBE76_18620 [Terracidiphilus sp.]
MQLSLDKLSLRRFRFYVIVGIILASVWGIQVYMYHKIFEMPGTIFSASSGTPAPPSDWQKMSVQAMSDTNALLTTLGTALLGAIGLMLVKARETSKSLHMWAAFLAAVSGGASLYFGYVSHLNLLAMISNQTFNPYDPVYLFSSHTQFYLLLAGAFFFADFAFHDLSESEGT